MEEQSGGGGDTAEASDHNLRKESIDILSKLAEFRIPKVESKADEEEGEEEEERWEEVEEAPVEVDPRKNLTKEHYYQFREIFDMLDTEKREKVPIKAIGIALKLMGLNPTKEEIKKLQREVDPHNKGYIDFYSFLLPLSKNLDEQPESHEAVIEAFKVFDEENKGYIENEHMIEYLTTLAEDLEDFEIDTFIKTADPKNTGKIQYQKFVEKMMGIKKTKGKPKKTTTSGDKPKKKKKKKK